MGRDAVTSTASACEFFANPIHRAGTRLFWFLPFNAGLTSKKQNYFQVISEHGIFRGI